MDEQKDDGFLKKIWKKTVFAKNAEKDAKDNALRMEAIKEADEELAPLKKDIIKEQYKQDEIARIKEKPKSFGDKLVAGFGGGSIGELASDEKLDRMLGNDKSNNKKVTYIKQSGSELGNSDLLNTDKKINMIMGKPMNMDKSGYMSDDEDKTDKIKLIFDEKDRGDKIKRMVK